MRRWQYGRGVTPQGAQNIEAYIQSQNIPEGLANLYRQHGVGTMAENMYEKQGQPGLGGGYQSPPGGMPGSTGFWGAAATGEGDQAWQAFQAGNAAAAGGATGDFYENQPWLQYLRSGEKPPGYGEWNFPTTGVAELGIKEGVPRPLDVPYSYFMRLDPDEQDQALALWRRVYNLTPEASLEYMRRGSYFGSGAGMTGWG